MKIMVLNDGETWTSAEGCLYLDVDAEDFDDSTLKEAYEHLTQTYGETVTVEPDEGEEGPAITFQLLQTF